MNAAMRGKSELFFLEAAVRVAPRGARCVPVGSPVTDRCAGGPEGDL